ncbi:MAG TPA: ubiquinol-cytochrome c reductase iron-sulfur subunit [Trichocoleus sp.]|jgi:cytochrome b6-f complex iron-sulfur subunit
MKRRDFIGLVGVGSAVPLAIVACTPAKENAAVSPPNSDGFQTVGTLSDLETNGKILIENEPTKVLVVRDPANPSSLIAVNPTCTHTGCTINWQKDQSTFICPCHASQFAADGKVLQGPANKPLAAYQVKVEGNSVLVKAG